MTFFSRVSALSFGLAAILALSACGWETNSAVDQAGEIPKANPPGSGEIITDDDGLENETPTTPNDPNEIRLFVEATQGMQQASTTQLLWELLTPAAAYALEAGDKVTNARITVRQVNFQGNIISGNAITAADYSVFLGEDGAYSIRFQNGIPDRLDLVIVAELRNGVILRYGLPNQKSSILINAGSEYAVRKFFSTLTSAQQLQSLTECATSDTECASQNQLRMTNWLAMMAAIQDFEITLPEDASLEEALQLLDNTLAVKDYAEQFSTTIVETKLGVVNGSAITPVMDARDGTYNSIYFALGLNQGISDAGQSIVYTHRANEPLTSTSGDRTTLTYPNLVFSPTILGVINNLLVETLPFTRTSTELAAVANYVQGPAPGTADINRFIGASISFMNSAGFMDLARLQIQSITQEATDFPTGWLTNPHYTKLYTSRNSASPLSSDSMVTAFWSTGQLLQLAKEGANYKRLAVDEEMNTFGWIFHSLTSPETQPFTASILDGQKYMVISLKNSFGLDPAMSWDASIDYWSVAGGSITSLQPLSTDSENAGGADVFTKLFLQRSTTDLGLGLAESRDSGAINLTLEALPNVVYSTTSKTYEDKFTGRLGVGEWTGISDPRGNVLSFNTENGGGIAHAVKVSNSVPALTNATYTLYGNSVSTEAGITRYHNHNLATLRFGEGEATLTMREATVTADHNSLQVSEPVDTSNLYTLTPATLLPPVGAIRNQIALEFTDPQGGSTPLVLEGAAASNGHLLVLRLRYGNRVGLLYGFKTLELTENSN
jgi:hypothetical protein